MPTLCTTNVPIFAFRFVFVFVFVLFPPPAPESPTTVSSQLLFLLELKVEPTSDSLSALRCPAGLVNPGPGNLNSRAETR
ncbi:hypothetical protein DFH27DRAFT_570743 [Peziza echinospora]|nr:hypothetical protein DFH27DRAFT_570743 [Peziza echinospora]